MKMGGFFKLTSSSIESNLIIEQTITKRNSTMPESESELAGPHKLPSNQNDLGVRPGQSRLIFLRIYTKDQTNGLLSETLYFQTVDQQSQWRAKLSSANAFFRDFQELYTIESPLSKSGSKYKYVVRRVDEGREKFVATQYKLYNFDDKKEADDAEKQVLGYCRLLQKLETLEISARFVEAYHDHTSFTVVEECVASSSFSEWFSNVWSMDLQCLSTQVQVVALLIELTEVVFSLHKVDVSHGGLKKHLVLIKSNQVLDLEKFQKQQSLAHQQKGRILGLRGQNGKLLKPSEPGSLAFLQTPLHIFPSAQGSKSILASPISSLGFIHSTAGAEWIRRMFVVGFSEKSIDLQQELSKVSDRSCSSVQECRVKLEKIKREFDLSKSSDVYKLGHIFYDIIFGIDIEMALEQTYGVEYEFCSQLLQSPHEYVNSRVPLYKLSKAIMQLLPKMLHPNPHMRPKIHECYKILSDCLSRLMKPDISPFQVHSKPRLSIETSFVMLGQTVLARETVAPRLRSNHGTPHSNSVSLISAIAPSSNHYTTNLLSMSKKEPETPLIDKNSKTPRYGTGSLGQSRCSQGSLSQAVTGKLGSPLVKIASKLSSKLNSLKQIVPGLKRNQDSESKLKAKRSSSCPLSRVCAAGRKLFLPENKLRKVRLSPRVAGSEIPGTKASPNRVTGTPDALVASVFRGTQLRLIPLGDGFSADLKSLHSGFVQSSTKHQTENLSGVTTRPHKKIGRECFSASWANKTGSHEKKVPQITIKLNKLDSL